MVWEGGGGRGNRRRDDAKMKREEDVESEEWGLEHVRMWCAGVGGVERRRRRRTQGKGRAGSIVE